MYDVASRDEWTMAPPAARVVGCYLPRVLPTQGATLGYRSASFQDAGKTVKKLERDGYISNWVA